MNHPSHNRGCAAINAPNPRPLAAAFHALVTMAMTQPTGREHLQHVPNLAAKPPPRAPQTTRPGGEPGLVWSVSSATRLDQGNQSSGRSTLTPALSLRGEKRGQIYFGPFGSQRKTWNFPESRASDFGALSVRACHAHSFPWGQRHPLRSAIILLPAKFGKLGKHRACLGDQTIPPPPVGPFGCANRGFTSGRINIVRGPSRAACGTRERAARAIGHAHPDSNRDLGPDFSSFSLQLAPLSGRIPNGNPRDSLRDGCFRPRPSPTQN